MAGNTKISALPAASTPDGSELVPMVQGGVTKRATVAQVTGATVPVDDTAYDATTWNGDTTHAPSKNAVRDKIESMGAGSADKLGLTPTAVKTTGYTAAVGDLVPCDTTSAGFTVTLPTAPADGSVIAVKLVIQGGTNAVTIACGGSDVFNKAAGATTGSLSILAQAMVLQYKASSAIWYVVADDLPLGSLDLRFAPLAPGFIRRTMQAKTGNYTAVSGDVVICDATGGAFTITLPAVAVGAFVTVKKKDSSANAITVSPASGTIDGAVSQLISTQYVSLDFISDATNWFLV